MKSAVFVSVILLTIGLSACAATQTANEASQTVYGLNTPIKALVADERAKAVLDKELPGLTTHAQYGFFKGMTLKELQPLSGGLITDERLKATEAALKTLSYSAE